jgi:ABC-2 type transport system ATP-binding protein
LQSFGAHVKVSALSQDESDISMNALSIEGLSKVYANGVKALEGISLNVAQGDFFALLGPNGAGKSTAIGILTSLVRKTAGRVQVFGHDIDQDFAAAKACMGVVPQEFNFNVFKTPLDILIHQAGFYGIPLSVAKVRAEEHLKRLGLWEKRAVTARSLSGGMKRRLMIARALMHKPKLLILDEPTAGVDIEVRRSMWSFLQTLNQQGVTIILTTHYLEEAEHLCRHVAIIDHGQIVKQAPMHQFLRTLSCASYTLELSQPLVAMPSLPDYNITSSDPLILDVTIAEGQSISALIHALSAQAIDVLSIRNKENRLEQLFLQLTSGD